MRRSAILLLVSTLLLPSAVCAEETKLTWPRLEVGIMPEFGHRWLSVTSCADCDESSKKSLSPGFVLSAGYRTEKLLLAGFGEFAWAIGNAQTNSLGSLGVLVRYQLLSFMAMEPRVFGSNWRLEDERNAANFTGLGGGMNVVLGSPNAWCDKTFGQLVLGGDASYLGSRRDAAGLTSVSAYAWSLTGGIRLSVLTRLGLD